MLYRSWHIVGVTAASLLLAADESFSGFITPRLLAVAAEAGYRRHQGGNHGGSPTGISLVSNFRAPQRLYCVCLSRV
jgi:hypothetical protein